MIRQFRQIASLLAASVVVSAQTNPIEKQAAAILQAKCLACHGAAKMADLDLRETPTMLKGGKRGPAVVPGKAEESLLYKAVKRDGELQMPPGKAPLTAAEVATLRDWINAGAKLESAAKTQGGPSWWSFKKPVRPAVPAVKNAADTQSDRRVHPREARTEGLRQSATGGSPHFGSPRVLRPARTAADAGSRWISSSTTHRATHTRS